VLKPPGLRKKNGASPLCVGWLRECSRTEVQMVSAAI